MDFGLTSNLDGKPICLLNGSGSLKHVRSDPFLDLGTRVLDSKIPKLSDECGLRSNNYNDSFPKQQMLSFSNNNLTGNLNGGMNGCITGVRGPFTPAQWMELEHQAMIYKYFTANVPVPANLLLPIRKSLTSTGFPAFSLASYSPHSYGWGSFHLGFSGSMDPEPGRCRRTDGKKWRCSRDAVPDQKYCERHINRGRHRSRKPVEGHIGQASSGPTNTNTKGVPPLPASMSSLVTSCGSASNSVTIAQHQIKSLHPPVANNISGDPIFNRFHDQQGGSLMPPVINLQSKDSTFSVPKQLASLGDSLQSEFGVVSNDPLLNPSHKSYNSLLEFNAQQSQDHYSLRHFMDDQSSHSAIAWPEVKSDRAQLSMFFPMSSVLSSPISSPNEEKMTISPLRLTSLFERSKTGLEVSIMDDEIGAKQNAFKIPIAWGNNTMGGPLGEVLNSASNGMGSCKSPQLGASPTGVLHKSTFVSLSNSSPGGSPKRDKM